MPRESHPDSFPANWNEDEYLDKNQDVAQAVRNGRCRSGYHHYLHFGRLEDRPAAWMPEQDARPTRDCTDPWRYLEVDVGGNLRPCCIHPPIATLDHEGGQATAEDPRNQPPIRQLRSSLLSGELPAHCRTCHIRPMTSTSQLRHRVANLLPEEADLDEPGPLLDLRLDLTTKCNLRCVYCAASQPGYQGEHMARPVFDQALSVIRDTPRPPKVHLNGHGETTHHPEWTTYIRMIRRAGSKMTLLSNFSKKFDPQEVAILAEMDVLQISLDSVNADLLKAIRRSVVLTTILANIEAIRQSAASRNLSPTWSLSCGVYDRNAAGLPDLARFAIDAGFHTVTFWNLVQYPALPDPKTPRLLALRDMAPEPRREARAAARKAVDILREHGIVVEVAGDFLNEG